MILSRLATTARTALSRLFCGHRARTAVPLYLRPDGRRRVFLCHCESCGATWSEYG